MSLEEIADLCGHSSTAITEPAYRHKLRPVLRKGAVTMGRDLQPTEFHSWGAVIQDQEWGTSFATPSELVRLAMLELTGFEPATP